MLSSLLSIVSTWTGATEAALAVLLGLLAAYPLLYVFRLHVLNKMPRMHQHLYLFLSGLALGLMAIGPSILIHNCVAVLVTFVVVKLAPITKPVVPALVFAFQLLYLFVGYLVTARDEYTIVWTLPQCVIALKLSGLAMDIFDESDINDELSLHEIFAYAFFPGSYLAGPQFSIRKFRAMFANHQEGRLGPADFESADRYSAQRFLLGVVYFVIHMVGSIVIVPESWPLTDDFESRGFLSRSFWFTLWAKFILAKYIGVWLMAEGACTLSTLSFVKRENEDKESKGNTNGQIDWRGVSNVNVHLYERCCRFQHLIDAFNINTNAWSAQYVFKRMKFLGNKDLSIFITLFFLAFWHGYHSGYYLTFFYEFIVMAFEKDVIYILNHNNKIRQLFTENEMGKRLCTFFGFLYVNFFIPHCFCPFAFLSFEKYAKVTWASGVVVPVFFGSWQLLKYPIKAMLATDKKEEKDKKKM